MKKMEVTLAKYEETLIGSVGGPIEEKHPLLVVLGLHIDGETRRIAMDASNAKWMVCDILKALKDNDETTKELYEAFVAIFKRKVKENAARQAVPVFGRQQVGEGQPE